MLLTYLIQVTLCMACFYSFYMFALQRETTFKSNRTYLIATLFISLILPWIKIYVDTQAEKALITNTQVFIGAFADELHEISVSAPASGGIVWINVFLGIYGAGVFALAIRLGKELFTMIRIRRHGQINIILDHPCILSSDVKTPFSFFNAIYLPAAHPFTEQELADVIHHEYSHIKGRHSVDILLMETLAVLFWMNPMVYLYRRKLRELHEYLADAEVIRHHHWESYAAFLISQKNYGLQNILSNQLVYSQLKNRLIMMAQKPSSMMSKIKYAGVLPVLLIVLVLFSFRGKNAEKQNEVNKIKDEFHLYEDGLNVYTKWDAGLHDVSTYDNTEQPLFPGCDKVPLMEQKSCSQTRLTAFIGKELIYPDDLVKENITGKVFVKFTVGANGLINEPSIERSLHPTADKAALEAVRKLNVKAGKWTPGRKEGRIVSMEMIIPISFAMGTNGKEEAFTYVEDMPEFPGSSEAMYQYLAEKIKYPNEDREKGLQGMVIVNFVVQPDGYLSDIKVLRGVSPGLDAEAIRVIESMNAMEERWTPGRHQGRFVPVKFTLPIKFILQSDKTDVDTNVNSEGNSKVVVTALGPSTQTDIPYTFVEQMPTFPGGTQNMYTYISSQLKYPAEDKNKGIEGQTIVQFTVSAEGLLKDINIVRSVTPAMDAEVIRILNTMNHMPERWVPGQHQGKSVAVKFTLPVKFVLNKATEKNVKEE